MHWIGAILVVLVVDYFTGPFFHSAVLFYLVPIAMAAWSGARRWSIALALLWPFLRLGIVALWGAAWPWRLTLEDTIVDCAVSLVIANLISRVVDQERKLRILEGRLPICGFCKRIRVGEEWQQLEQYITDHSEAEFSHTFCPECGRLHYPDYQG